MKRLSIFLCILLCVSASLRLSAQVRPVNDYGALGLGQLLRKLQTTGSVMMIGAHPDDEDSALLAYLARGENARTAYLSLTRGDGGQNIIGPELFEPLGVIRTEELLQARRLDGAEQYFTRAFDYGFSKTLGEARSKWPEEAIKCDVVRAIRSFKPLVVISRFSGTPQDGHGQHQYAGYITPVAVKAAADWNECPSAGDPYQVKKFYVEQGFGDNLPEPTLKINTGQFDPILGRTYFEIAMEGRSLHRSQGEGRIEFHGDSFSGLNLVGADKTTRENDIFDGLNVAVGGIALISGNTEGPFAVRIKALAAKTEEVIKAADLMHPQASVRPLAELWKLAHDAEWSTRVPESKFRLQEFQRKIASAIRTAANIEIDALADSETVIPGGETMVSVKVFQPRTDPVSIGDITIAAAQGAMVTKIDPPKQNNAAFNSREVASAGSVFSVKVPASADLTEPYWLRTGREGDMFTWPKTGLLTYPFDSPWMASVPANFDGTMIPLPQTVQFRFADTARGEIRREVNVVPAFSVAVDRDLLIAPISDKPQTRRLVVSVTNNSATPQTGSITLNIGASKDVKVVAPQGTSFDLKTRGAKASIPVDITIPRTTVPEDIDIHAAAVVGDAKYNLTMNTIAYPHIQTHRYYTPADATLKVIDLKSSPLNIGYVMGSGDEVPEAIRQMGMKVTMLQEQDLASGDLSKFDTVVVGIRASETRPDLVANNQRLLDYAKNGGNVVMLYQRFAWTGLAPFPVNTQDKQGTTAGSINRVVDENAPVKILDPADAVFNTPNKITEADFAGWVQERNAYNLVTFDPHYKPLLESHDAGEQENNGGLVRAQLGKGTWTYCSYSFFRQLPAGVPGAYRLFDNILSVPRGK